MPDPRKMHQISGMPIGEWIVVEGEELWVEDLDVGTLPGIGLYALVKALRRDGSRCTFRATWAT